jgi:hypothetical protein
LDATNIDEILKMCMDLFHNTYNNNKDEINNLDCESVYQLIFLPFRSQIVYLLDNETSVVTHNPDKNFISKCTQILNTIENENNKYEFLKRFPCYIRERMEEKRLEDFGRNYSIPRGGTKSRKINKKKTRRYKKRKNKQKTNRNVK